MKEKSYKKLDLNCYDLEEAFRQLKEFKETKKENVCMLFNDYIITSDMSLNKMYKVVTGKSYRSFKRGVKRDCKKFKNEERKYLKKLPKLKKFWEERGNSFITKNKEDWLDCVDIRLKDIYQGYDLECFYDLAILINDKNYNEAKNLLQGQGHSGFSYSVVTSMLNHFLNNGEEFLRFIGEDRKCGR